MCLSYEDSLKANNGKLAYEDVSDDMIDYFIAHPKDVIDENHRLLYDSDEDTVDNLLRILYQVRRLKKGKSLVPIEIWYQHGNRLPDIYDGWHRIRAYQYMGYRCIPCVIHVID